jgi:hypothetical protein
VFLLVGPVVILCIIRKKSLFYGKGNKETVLEGSFWGR